MSVKVDTVKAAQQGIMNKMREFAQVHGESSNPEVKKLRNLVDALLDMYDEEVPAEVVKALEALEIDLKPFLSTGDVQHPYKIGMVIVPTVNASGYTKGSPALVYYENCAVHFKKDGSRTKVVSGARLPEGNTLSEAKARLATPAEVTSFFGKLVALAQEDKIDWHELDRIRRASN